ncbi:hypothetical protein [Rhizobium johnstonii]|uniref:hypothetical protein n=1 Tax=Rhizobium johnstonii TaxID=3019933 RepID=UPI003F9562C0
MTTAHILTLPGAMLKRGFWLYVWRVFAPKGEELLYVGRTGDNSSPHATAPYTRMGQHLSFSPSQNALRRHLLNRNIAAEDCHEFDLIAYGPLYDEVSKGDGMSRADLMAAHIPLRDLVGALEKVLAEELKASGYDVLNTVKWKHPHEALGWVSWPAAGFIDIELRCSS